MCKGVYSQQDQARLRLVLDTQEISAKIFAL